MLYDIQLDTSPATQILKLLQRQGASTIKDIEAALGVTTTAVRQQLTALRAEGLVSTKTVREKRGRPHAVYRLSDKGQKLFAHGYENLAQMLIEEVLGLSEPENARQLLQRVSTRLGAQYAEHVQGAELEERLQQLVVVLEQGGITSKVEEEDRAFILTEYSCPYYGLAQAHREICSMEVEAMQKVLGSEVILHQSQLDGHHGCQFQVKKD
ncbi:MAG: ArsR family transcriptional regulator [bacterium]|nr:ArsR family transcriptional regulator [bacterium]